MDFWTGWGWEIPWVTKVAWIMTQTGWTGQDFWPGYVSRPVQPVRLVLHSPPTVSYNAFSAGDVTWDGIRMQGINVWCLLIPKMYFSVDLIDVQLYTVKIWHPCICSTKIWTSIKPSKKYIFGILKCHISTPCTQIPFQNPSPTYKPFKDAVHLIAEWQAKQRGQFADPRRTPKYGHKIPISWTMVLIFTSTGSPECPLSDEVW